MAFKCLIIHDVMSFMIVISFMIVVILILCPMRIHTMVIW